MKKAAVLILIYKNSIVFIKRNKNLKIHPGEISFPGGTFDKRFDKDLKDTAIRETYEEIGISPDEYKIIKKMHNFYTLITNIEVIPFVAKSNKKELNFKINNSEVEDILIIPIAHLIDARNKVVVPIKFNGKLMNNTFYYYKNNLIWGATSRILDEFLAKKETLNQLFY